MVAGWIGQSSWMKAPNIGLRIGDLADRLAERVGRLARL